MSFYSESISQQCSNNISAKVPALVK